MDKLNYLARVVIRKLKCDNSLCRWHNLRENEGRRNLFYSVKWSYFEINRYLQFQL